MIYGPTKTPQNVPIESIVNKENFNPFRDLQHGGTLLGFNGWSFWISDECLIGKLLKLIFK